MENKNQSFSYTYSANQQEEIKQIRKKYLPLEEDKMAQLRRLDRSVTQKATIYSLIIGIIGTLIMGFGMSCCMVWTENLFILGIVVGIIGIAVLAIAYPIYNYVLKREREKVTPEIMRITDELMK